MRVLSVSLLASVALTAAPVQAQDFLGGIARSAAQSAAQRLANRAVQSVKQPHAPAAPAATAPASRAAPAAASAATPAATPPTASAPAQAATGVAAGLRAPVPVRYLPTMRTPGEMEFSQADQDARTALRMFGRVDCTDCEGGYDFETWVKHQVPAMWGNNVLGNHLGGLAVGQNLTWTGRTSRGQYAITVVDTQSVGKWECKQLVWSGRRGERTADAPGLICKVGDNWLEVF